VTWVSVEEDKLLVRCIAGALTESGFGTALETAGFERTENP
jgi:methylthioribose-1-phosphate isomerase